MNKLVEIICKMSQDELQEFAKECMKKGIAIPLEYALHVEQLNSDMESEE